MIQNIVQKMVNRLLKFLYFFQKRSVLYSILFAIMLSLQPYFSMVYGQNVTKKKITVLEIFDEINPLAWRKTNGAFTYAEKNKSDLLLIHLNTYGGLLESGDSIRTRILNSKIPSILFIDNNAASAGALIAIACNKIYMRSGGNIGAATVVDQEGKPLPDKYQSYMRSIMRSTAETRGRNPKIAEAMVDPRTFISGVNDSGKVLTFTATEAMKNNYCNGIAETIEEVLKQENITSYELKPYEATVFDKIIGFLTNPAVSGILILIMLGGLYFELQHPGIGLPLIAAILAAAMYFAPHYLEGLAANWEILLFIAGLILIGLEIFVIPGFGAAGIGGIALVVIGLTLSLVNNVGFDFSFTPSEKIIQSLAIVVAAMVGTLILFIATGSSLIHSKRFQKLVLTQSMEQSHGYTSQLANFSNLIGKSGKSITILRPSGKIEIENEIYTASAESGYIEKDRPVNVIRNDGVTVVVREIR